MKYEEVYLQDYADGADAWRGLDRYFTFYNTARRHQSLDRRTPAEVHFQVKPEGYLGMDRRAIASYNRSWREVLRCPQAQTTNRRRMARSLWEKKLRALERKGGARGEIL
ncbi:MAG: hypothetical protein CV088_17810 [Nitrospira sp. LK70]|nr:hypothetical protein [Nitrospira sp. LK70]